MALAASVKEDHAKAIELMKKRRSLRKRRVRLRVRLRYLNRHMNCSERFSCR